MDCITLHDKAKILKEEAGTLSPGIKNINNGVQLWCRSGSKSNCRLVVVAVVLLVVDAVLTSGGCSGSGRYGGESSGRCVVKSGGNGCRGERERKEN